MQHEPLSTRYTSLCISNLVIITRGKQLITFLYFPIELPPTDRHRDTVGILKMLLSMQSINKSNHETTYGYLKVGIFKALYICDINHKQMFV